MNDLNVLRLLAWLTRKSAPIEPTIETINAILGGYDIEGKAFVNVFHADGVPKLVVIYDNDDRPLFPAFHVADPFFEVSLRDALQSVSKVAVEKAKDAELNSAIDAEDAYRIAKEYDLGEGFVISINANPCDASIRIAAILLQMANKSFSPVFRWEKGALTEQTWREALDSCGVHKGKADVNEIPINFNDVWQIAGQYEMRKGWSISTERNDRRELESVTISNASDKRVFEWKAENGDILTAHKWGVALATFGKLKGETK